MDRAYTPLDLDDDDDLWDEDDDLEEDEDEDLDYWGDEYEEDFNEHDRFSL